METPHALKVGMPISLSGQFQVQGEQALAGLQAWAGDVNRMGGIKVGGSSAGWPVSVVYYDDGSRPRLARRVTERLIIGDQVDLLFGPYSGVLALAAAEVAEEHAKVLWNQGGASDAIYRRGFQWVVGILSPASRYLAALLPMVRESQPQAESLAILRVSPGVFAKAVSSGVERAASLLDFHTTVLEEYEPTIKDFNPILNQVEDARPEVLVAVGRIHNDLLLAEQLVQRRLNLEVVAVVATPIQQFRDALGDGADGFVGPSQWEASGSFVNDYGPPGSQVLASLRKASRHAVDYPMVQAYAAGLVAQRCVEAAGTLEDRTLRETAGMLDFSTFYGRFKIDSDTGRQEGRSPVIVQWQKGRKVIVWPPEQRQAGLIHPWR